jgi:hypothetical protein
VREGELRLEPRGRGPRDLARERRPGRQHHLRRGLGAIIDHNKGTAYTYPTWVQLVFGKTLVFDRSAEKDGQPVMGAEPVGSK